MGEHLKLLAICNPDQRPLLVRRLDPHYHWKFGKPRRANFSLIVSPSELARTTNITEWVSTG